MNPITNSTVKEQMRQRNEATANSQESQIRIQLNNDINKLTYKNCVGITGFLILGAVIGIVFAAVGLGFGGFCVGVGIGVIIWAVVNGSVKSYNSSIDNEKQRLTDAAYGKIRDAYTAADQKTVREINQYDSEVKQHTQKVMKNRESIRPMVDHATDMFQRMIGHADSSSHMRFIEADFTYQVVRTGITYSYQSRYTNPQDDYNFNRERYRDLNSDAECEGLAQALAKLVIAKMKSIYPANSINITVSHNDARVSMHFKGANKNFVPARDIL